MPKARSQPAAVPADPGDDRLSGRGLGTPGAEARSGPPCLFSPLTSPAGRIKGQARQAACRTGKKTAFTAARRTFRFFPATTP